mmetsp:Transcript_23337/g.34595  ORF Transcript_23337/g.34595 Transcript_23337/m.34595 type:complete len:204 (-) Transcript_23337:2813-3424(-)
MKPTPVLLNGCGTRLFLGFTLLVGNQIRPPSPNDTLHNNDIHDIKLEMELGRVCPVSRLDHDCAYVLEADLVPYKESTSTGLEHDDFRQPINCSLTRVMGPPCTLNQNQAIKVIVHTHGSQIASYDPLNLACTVILLVEGVSCQPATECPLNKRRCVPMSENEGLASPPPKVGLQLNNSPHPIDSFLLCQICPSRSLNGDRCF